MLKLFILLGDDTLMISTASINERELSNHIATYYNMNSKLTIRQGYGTFLQLCVFPNKESNCYSIGPDYRRLKNRWEVAPDHYDNQDF